MSMNYDNLKLLGYADEMRFWAWLSMVGKAVKYAVATLAIEIFYHSAVNTLGSVTHAFLHQAWTPPPSSIGYLWFFTGMFGLFKGYGETFRQRVELQRILCEANREAELKALLEEVRKRWTPPPTRPLPPPTQAGSSLQA